MYMEQGPFLIKIDDFLTHEECQKFIDYFNSTELTYVDRGNAQYNRGILNDTGLAATIYDLLKEYLPQTYNGSYLSSCNPVFRFSKYEPGQEFQIHKDGINQYGEARSVLTVNIFLNEDFEGGSTNFYKSDKTLRAEFKPKTGRAAVFDSQQYHSGEKVLSGYKYLLRTDVMGI